MHRLTHLAVAMLTAILAAWWALAELADLAGLPPPGARHALASVLLLALPGLLSRRRRGATDPGACRHADPLA